MTKAKRSEGPRAPLFYCVLAFAHGSLALAQSVDVAELERCAGLESDALKLACFEAVVAAAGEAPQPVLEPPAEAPPEPMSAERTSTSDTVAAPARAEERAPLPASAAASPTTARAVREPAERVEEAKPDVVHATVVEVTKDSYGALIFRFDNGQVWRQLEKRYYPYPKDRQFDVTISTGMMGESRMQVEGAGRKVTIRRIR